MILNRESIEFASTGRKVEGILGPIGIDANLDPAYGWDGTISECAALTAEERRELADHMIGLWQAYKDQQA